MADKHLIVKNDEVMNQVNIGSDHREFKWTPKDPLQKSQEVLQRNPRSDGDTKESPTTNISLRKG